MTSMKKSLHLTWMAALTLVVAGCGGGDNEGNAPAEGEANGATESEEQVELNLYTWINEENGNWQATIEAYEEANPNVTINMNTLVENMDARDYYQQLDLLASSGEELDLIMLSSSQDLSRRASLGMFAPLNEYFEEEGIDIDEEYNMGATPSDDEGNYFGLPMKYNTYLVMMNKDHLDEAGLEIPTDWTWDDYREYASALTEDGRYGSYFHTWDTIWNVTYLLSKESNNLLIQEDGSSNMEDPAIEASLQLRYDLEQVDQSSEPFANVISQDLNYRQQFFQGSASMVPIPSFMVTEWGGHSAEFPIAWAPWPKENADDPQYRYASSDSIAIGNQSENKEAAYEFIRWMSTEGMLEQNKSIPAWRQTDLEEVVTNLASTTDNPEAIHIESLLHVLETGEESEQFLPPSYMGEVYSAYGTEVQRYLLGDQDIETTLENATQEVQRTIDANN
ncbi:extracellular solute-binding protein [Paenalkalicoccus suaedae]|uniref:Extracellular solute-binding protein n=1 Tax=Paenalkalicoccus suaedae TaxID=2592382 RepID=A0A859FJ70_9BACI|nr:extracellular solute-binding protein [Paenalkalicoccus suaedae]QKS72505.1 extracellular solute-binding protein [Paenalkalicoccus suaedae]